MMIPRILRHVNILLICLLLSSVTLIADNVRLSQTSLNFGTTYTTSIDSLSFWICNDGTSAIIVKDINTYSGVFIVRDTAFTVFPHDSVSIRLYFYSIHNLTYTDVAIIENTGKPSALAISVSGVKQYPDSYYSSTQGLSGEALKTAIFNLTTNHTNRGYDGIRDLMFLSVDTVAGQLECVYTGRKIAVTNRSDMQSSGNFNTEHTWPQSKFNEQLPMKADINHLFPTDETANGRRSSYPFDIVVGTPTWEVGGSKLGRNSNNAIVFEPRDVHKGDLSRAMFYFIIRYQNWGTFWTDAGVNQEATFRLWNKQDPVSAKEITRNNRIAQPSVQGKRNPFIDHPEFVDRITKFDGTATLTTAPKIIVEPLNLNTGFAFPNDTAQNKLTIVNSGTDTLFITTIASSNPVFSVITQTNIIPPDTFIYATVLFLPTDTASSQTGTITINSNDIITGQMSINVEGTSGTNINLFTINSSSGQNGTITPSGGVYVGIGSDTSFLFTPNSGYHIDSIIVDGVKVDSVSSYTFFNVTANHTILVTFKANDLTYGLVAYYPFNGNADDESGNGNNGIVNGAILSNDRFGLSNSAFEFSGGNSWIEISNSNNLIFTNAFTISVWASLIDTETTDCQFISKGLISHNGYYGVGYSRRDFGGKTYPRFYGLVRANEAISNSTGSIMSPPKKIWQHIVLTYDSTYLRMYINSNLNDNKQLMGPLDTTNSSILYIGRNGDGNNPFFMYGTLDDIRIYNRVLSQTEIDSLYHENGWDAINPCPGSPSVSYSGKTYNTVQIGTQCWMKENLDIGTMIHGFANQTNNNTIEKYCYNNDPSNCTTNGGLYQWNEAMQYDSILGTQGICPTGWHMPTIEEFQTLKLTVNNNGNALKAVGQGTGTNSSGFSALLSGYRTSNFYFGDINYFTYFWSSTKHYETDADDVYLFYSGSVITFDYIPSGYGLNVRCLKNEELLTYILNDSIVGNGTISRNPDKTVYAYASTVLLTATPDSCYHFVNWSGDTSSTQNPLTVTMNSNKNITANFAIDLDTISISAGANGSISQIGTVFVNCGVDTLFTFTPNTCYQIDSVIVDGVKVDSLTSYTFSNVTSNHTIRVTFVINKDTITATTGTNGSITPSGVMVLDCGASQRFIFSPSLGYYVDSVLVDGIKVDSTQGYTFSDITINHTIRVTFKEYLSSLSGKVFHDLNGNGQFDSGETGLLNWQVTLKKSGSSTIDTVNTDANGFYSLSNLSSGKYIVREILQGGWIQTSSNPDTITVIPGSTITGINFGNGHRSSICGVKYEDKNGNGHRDAGEPGLQGWTILLSGTSNASLQTDPTGNYCFTNLLPGYYIVSEAQQGGWKQTQGGYSIQLSSGIDTICNFGNFRYGSISGLKFHDLNGDGAMAGPDSGISGWKIYLEKDGSSFSMKTTSFDGSYSFDSLMYGVYKLSEETRPGWIQTTHPTRNDTVYSGKTFINRNFGNVFGLSMDILAKWNMVSLPLGVLDNRKSIVFPNAISSAFTFEGSYQSKTALLNGNGYWLKFDSAQTVNLIGDVIAKDTINVTAGWNMIGSISDTISVSCILPIGTSIQSSYFGYLNGYVSSDIILPGKAYWVKVSNYGQLILKSCGMFGKIK